MRSFTQTIPKALIPVLDIPFAHYQLQYLAKQGFRDVVYSIGYLGEQIREYVGDGSTWGLKVTYVDEGKNLLGTGGAIRFAIDQKLMAEAFFVTYGDAFLQVDYQGIYNSFLKSTYPALMTVFKNKGLWDKSNVNFDGKMVTRYNKTDPGNADHIDYGVLCFRRQTIIDRIPSAHAIDLAATLQRLSEEGLLMGFEAKERFYEIGSPQGLSDFEAKLQSSGR